ncbi:MAG: hypothetical protein MUC36_14410 [Planctomycetes bacterium]|jgi:hypothetical protein|nr:hypothetical protein [Planctomycetota bacterium]
MVLVQFLTEPDRKVSLEEFLFLGDSFRICAESHRWPPLETFNAFLGCGVDDSDGDLMMWRPFEVDPAAYSNARLHRDPSGVVETLGTIDGDWSAWFAAAVGMLRPE